MTNINDFENINLSYNPKTHKLSYNVQGKLIIDKNCSTCMDDFSMYKCGDNCAQFDKYPEKNKIYIDEDEHDDDTSQSDDQTQMWTKYQGKNVMLMEVDDPWFMNKNHNNENFDYVSNFIYGKMNQNNIINQPYVETQASFDGTEHFGCRQNDNQLVFIVLLILFSIIIWKLWRK